MKHISVDNRSLQYLSFSILYSHPYLMFSTHESIYKHILNGSTSYTEQVLTPPSFGILGLTYHLRFDHIIISLTYMNASTSLINVEVAQQYHCVYSKHSITSTIQLFFDYATHLPTHDSIYIADLASYI